MSKAEANVKKKEQFKAETKPFEEVNTRVENLTDKQ